MYIIYFGSNFYILFLKLKKMLVIVLEFFLKYVFVLVLIYK